MAPTEARASAPGKRKRILFYAIALGISMVFALGIAEIVLRILPIPGIIFHSSYYDDLTGGRYYPNTTLIYHSPRGGSIRREVNSLGFVDRDHDIDKAAGVVRIGFFGDSYTQALQVPLEQTFFRLIEDSLNVRSSQPSFECIAFGVSGRSTLQSYLECTRSMGPMDLDIVVYVFAENDLGDQMRVVKRSPNIPYAYLSGDSFAVDFSFRERTSYKSSRLHRAQQYVKARSLVLSTLVGRLKLLRKHGIKMTLTEEDRQMAGGRRESTEPPNQNAAPSGWPDTLRTEAMDLGERVLAKWADEVAKSGRRFVVLYVPREPELPKPRAEQDSWAAWLFGVTRDHGIEAVDLTEDLIERQVQGKEVYFDHFTPAGHEAAASAFVRFLAEASGP